MSDCSATNYENSFLFMHSMRTWGKTPNYANVGESLCAWPLCDAAQESGAPITNGPRKLQNPIKILIYTKTVTATAIKS